MSYFDEMSDKYVLYYRMMQGTNATHIGLVS